MERVDRASHMHISINDTKSARRYKMTTGVIFK